MFDYLEPDTSDDQGNPGTGSLPLSSEIGGQGQGTRSLPRSLNPEKVRHMLYGSLAGIDRTIKILHALGYTDPNDWSDPIPVPPSAGMGDTARSLRLRSATGAEMPASGGVEMWMAIATKTVLIE
ncbi:hypothetical protein [Nodosilinea nodulosa]|uniref:hypothetical protein n=1 Tax=Nodosilinea nodulosa TaxID=416001 RepID=UPI00031D8110|nr:hypothetical protein [Nodosilinea nodulosa]